MSQPLWSRSKSEDIAPAPADQHHPRGTIPPNPNSKSYSLAEAFLVWDTNKEAILHAPTQSVPSGSENYRLKKPSPIHHLDVIALQRDGQNDQTPRSEAIDALNASDSFAQPKGSNPNTNSNSNSNSHSNSTLMAPEEIEWFYIDPSGKEQGPFTGDLMQEWLTFGYITLTLQIRRKEESSFRLVSDFCKDVGNQTTPFSVPLPSLSLENPPSLLLQIPQFSNLTLLQQPSDLPSVSSMNHQGYFLGQPVNSQVNYPLSQLNDQINLPLNQSLNQPINQSLGQPMNQPLMGLGAGGMRISLNPSSNLFGSIDTFGTSTFGFDLLNISGHPNSHQHPHNLLQPSLHHLLLQLQIQTLHIQLQLPVLSRSNSGWMAQPTSNPSILGSQIQGINQPSPMSPWLTGVSQLRVSSPFIESKMPRESEPIPVNETFGNFQASSNSQSLPLEAQLKHDMEGRPVPQPITQKTPNSTFSNERRTTAEVENLAASDFASSIASNVANLDSRNQRAERETSVVPKDVSSVAPKPSTKDLSDVSNVTISDSTTLISKPLVPKPPVAATATRTQPIETHSQLIEEEKVEPSPKPASKALAPWATPSSDTKPQLSFKEIQEIEAEKNRKEREAQIKANEVAAKLANDSWIAEQNSIAAASVLQLPKASGWATSASSDVPVKSLVDIQREEQNAKLKSATLQSASQQTSSHYTSFALAVANSTPKDESGWTVVPKKSVVKKMTPLAPSTPTLSSAKVDPQQLRNVLALRQTPSINANGAREDFMVWARTQMAGIYPLVLKDELLEVFVQFPSGPDSQLLIAETIYSLSATMDGRRFAKEFMDRRNKIDREAGPCEDWQAIISLLAGKTVTVDEDGWTTGKKKKGRR